LNLEEVLHREPSQSRIDRHSSNAKDSLSAVSETLSGAMSPRKTSSMTSSSMTTSAGVVGSLLSRLPANIPTFQQDVTLIANEEIFARFSLLTKMIYFLGIFSMCCVVLFCLLLFLMFFLLLHVVFAF
jgi:hypothetical protein